MKKKGFRFLVLAFASASLSQAELVDVTLTLTPATATENTLALSLSVTGIASSDTSQGSGTVQARLDLDPETGEISTFELLSGDISATGVNFVGRFFGIVAYNLSTTTLGATVDTPSPPAPVLNGQTAADLHELIINSGTLSGTSAAGAIPPQDFADTNVTGTGAPGDFVEISAELNASSTETNRVFDIDLAFPVAITQDIEAEGLSATVTANGNVRALGQAALIVEPPNPYLVWAVANGLSEAPFEGLDFDSQLPNGLFWALGYDAGESATSLESSGTAFTLNPGPGGTVAEVTVQATSDLSDANSWTKIQTIASGTTSATTIPFAGTSPQFFRLRTTAPE